MYLYARSKNATQERTLTLLCPNVKVLTNQCALYAPIPHHYLIILDYKEAWHKHENNGEVPCLGLNNLSLQKAGLS